MTICSTLRFVAVTAALVIGLTSVACTSPPQDETTKSPSSSSLPRQSDSDDSFGSRRRAMMDRQLRQRDITDERVLDVFSELPREEFVPHELRDLAYFDQPLPIGNGQTISQPYIVALMTQLAQVKPESVVLDIGTGSGYQAAVLGKLAKHVYSIEIIPELAEQAEKRLARLGFENITVRAGDGYAGWPDHAPFDAIIVAAAPDHVPPKLVEQLAVGARLIIPVGKDHSQVLKVIERQSDGTLKEWDEAPVIFVPMTGSAQKDK